MKDCGQLEHLINVFGNGSQIEFAKLSGLTQSTLATWKNRQTIAPERIKAAFPQVDGNWLLTGKGQMLLPNEDKSSVQVNGHNNTTQITSSGNINNHKTPENESNSDINEIKLLRQEIASLRALLNEKERLINVLLEHTKGPK